MLDAAVSSHPDVICLSHLRWDFVFQRPQHLLTRCAREHRVFFVEEPLFQGGITPHLRVEADGPVTVVVPHLPEGLPRPDCTTAQRALLDDFIEAEDIRDYVLWYYTPMALDFTRHLSPRAVVYDCMDELSAFQGAPAALREHEAELMVRASLVLTGGRSLYEAKRHQHHNIHALPSSVDVAHFARARGVTADPPDQAGIPHPRLGFFGVIDERLDIALVDAVAAARPDWHLVMIGPVVKIDAGSLPRRPNIHYLGSKAYAELPRYLAGWDVALLPFARNEATRFISPTKTPEYMAAGKPVVSTSIHDVVRPYGEQGLVRIADEMPAFVDACLAAMSEDAQERVTAADAFLRQTSWDGTWTRIRGLLRAALRTRDAQPGKTTAVDAAAV
jgi:glycosyltransferase involved in cell wall biosynthesis